MATPYRFFGASLIAGALVPLGYPEFNRPDVVQPSGLQWLYQTLAVIALAVAVLAEVTVVRHRSRPDLSWGEEVADQVRRQWLPCGMIALMVGLGLWAATGGGPLIPTVLANAATIVFAIWLMQVGLRDDRGSPFAAGVACFLLWAVLRYIDLFGAYGGMLGGAVVFLLCGAVLFGVALFWRHRKAVHLG